MSKMDSYMQGRTEGMEFALRLVKDKGIEELEKEIKFRQRTGISLNVTRQELNAASNKIKEMTCSWTETIRNICSWMSIIYLEVPTGCIPKKPG